MYSAIIDNTALVYLTQLYDRRPFLDLLRNIIHTLYIPMAVKNEYARGLAKDPRRFWLLDRVNTEHGFYRLCTSYDTFVNILVEKSKGIDKGESESYSQFKKINAQLLISDDNRFTKAVNQLDKGVKVYSSLHLICWLDILGFLPMDWNRMVKEIHSLRPFQSRDLREAYFEIISKTGVLLHRKLPCAKGYLNQLAHAHKQA